MGTTWNASVVVTSAEESREAAALQAPLQKLLDEVNQQMSTYIEDSELSRFNRHASAEPFAVSPELARVTRRALQIGAATDGAFDVTLGPLIALWGFDKDGRRTTPPPAKALAAARARVGLERVRVDGDKLVKTKPDVEVNLSGIAKGYGSDVVHNKIVAAGFDEAMVEIGGEVRASGKNPAGKPWRLGVNVPRSDSDPTSVLTTVPVKDRGLATSGDYRNFFEAGGRRYSHIIDPKKGEPVERPPVSVSVLAPDCMTADALATAGMVLGEEKMRPILARLEGTSALFVTPKADGEGYDVVRTPGFPAP